ncbi:pteridine reductase [Methylomonas sp. AM2-LC]|uniref:pteridine reductase n=1 Tax=Methylomonas sp. AM2-LC TaxID=3153301 RepID=UPI003267A2A1
MHKNVLITGAARRIGAACARVLHDAGCNLILHYHSSAELAEQLHAELNAKRENSAVLFQADLQDMQALQNLAKFAVDSWQGLDVLVNNAAQFNPGVVGTVSESNWDSLIGSNLKAPFFLSQALASFLAKRHGCIINIADIYAEKGLPGYPVYSISKAGLLAMTHCLAKDLAPDVRVNAIAPGAILWPEHTVTEAEKNQILQRVALQRCGQADDVAKAVRFLIADADYITGHTLTIDGGRTLYI